MFTTSNPDGALPRRSCLDLSRGLLLTFNGPILCRPILRRRGRHLKLIAVCHVAIRTVATLPVAGFTRGEDLIEVARDFFFFFDASSRHSDSYGLSFIWAKAVSFTTTWK